MIPSWSFASLLLYFGALFIVFVFYDYIGVHFAKEFGVSIQFCFYYDELQCSGFYCFGAIGLVFGLFKANSVQFLAKKVLINNLFKFFFRNLIVLIKINLAHKIQEFFFIDLVLVILCTVPNHIFDKLLGLVIVQMTIAVKIIDAKHVVDVVVVGFLVLGFIQHTVYDILAFLAHYKRFGF